MPAIGDDTDLDILDLDSDKRPEEALENLRKVGPGAFPDVLSALPDMSTGGQRRAAFLLSMYADEMESVERFGGRLIALLRKLDDPIVRERLSSAIEKCGPKNASALMRLLGDEDHIVRDAAIAAMARMGTPVHDRVERLLESSGTQLRAAGLEIVGLNSSDVTRFDARTIELCADPDNAVRAAALAASARTARNRPAALERLLLGLDDGSPEAARGAIRGLHRFGPDAIPAILKTIEARRGAGCSPHIEALRQFDAKAELERGLAIEDPAACLAVVEGFATPTAASAARLRELSTAENVAVRIRAAELLGDGPEDRSRLLELGRDPASPVRAKAVWQLSFQPVDEAAAKLFADAAKDEDPDVRAAAWRGNWRSGSLERADVGLLRELLTKHDSIHVVLTLGQMDAAAIANLDALLLATRSKKPETVVAAVRAIAEAMNRHLPGTPRYRRHRFEDAPKWIRERCTRAWDWLASQQEKLGEADGRGWDSDRHGGHPQCDVGVSALALLSFTAAGWHADSTKYSKAMRDGLAFLYAAQREDGRIGRAEEPAAIQHALATNALTESLFLGPPTERHVAAARKAIEYSNRARNPYLGWRYKPRGGENDTFVTVWMFLGLRHGEWAGLGHDPDAYEGTRLWLDKMTDPEFGKAGYRVAGGSPSRIDTKGSLRTEAPGVGLTPPFPVFQGTRAEMERYKRAQEKYERALAAVAHKIMGSDESGSTTAMCVFACGLMPDADAALDKKLRVLGLDQITMYEPAWDPAAWKIDLFYWMFGARSIAVADHDRNPKRQAQKKWRQSVQGLLRAHQNEDGSWPAAGVWGSQGGQIYSTAMAVMTLLGDVPFGPDLTGGELPSIRSKVRSRLQELREDPRREVAIAAEAAVSSIRPDR